MDAVTASAAHKTKETRKVQRAFSILLFAVFIIVDLLALVAGTSSYGSITKMQQQNDARVMTLGPITSSVRANDVQGGIASGKGPEGKSLVLTQHDQQGTYETRIYLYQGKIVQEFSLSGTPYTPEKATKLSDSSTFTFAYDDGLLTINTDGSEAKIALRNLQGGA